MRPGQSGVVMGGLAVVALISGLLVALHSKQNDENRLASGRASAPPAPVSKIQTPRVHQLARRVSRSNNSVAANPSRGTEERRISPAVSGHEKDGIQWSTPDAFWQQQQRSGSFVHLQDAGYSVPEELELKGRIVELVSWMKDHPDINPSKMPPPQMLDAIQSRLRGSVTLTVDGTTIALSPSQPKRDAGE